MNAFINNSKKKSSIGIDAIRLTISKIITLLITTITTMLVARFRSVEEYGTYSELLLTVNIVVSVFMLGLPNSINFFLARAETKAERQKYLSVYYTLSTILSIIIGVVLVLSIPVIEAYFHNPAIRGFWYFCVVYPWSSVVEGSVENLLVIYQKTSLLMLYRFVYSIFMLGVAIGVQRLGYGFSIYMVCFVVVNVIFTIWVYLIANYLSGGIVFWIDIKLIKSILAFSVPMGLATVVGTFNTEIDKLLIGYLMSTEEMAIYTNAAKELPLAIIASSITAVLLPELILLVKKDRTSEAVELWGNATVLALIIIAFVVSGVFTYAEEVLTILYSAKYIKGVTVFRIYTLNLILRVTYFGIILNSFGETKKIAACGIASLGLNVVLNPVCYMVFGMVGPAIATFVTIVLVMLLQLSMTATVTNIKFSKLLPWNRIIKIILINISFGSIFYIIKRMLHIDIILGNVCESLALGIIWSLVYFSIMKKQIKCLWQKLKTKE